MRAIEINTKTDSQGRLKLNYPIYKRDQHVRVIIMVDDNTEDEEKLWLNALSSNPAFDFLKEPEEDIYSIMDGEPFNDKR